MEADNPDERFPPTGGRVAGVVSIALGVGAVVFSVVETARVSWAGIAFGLLLAGLGWAVFLRPRVSIEDDDLVLRGMVGTRRLPLAAVEEVAVQQVLAVRVGEKRFTSTAVGRTRRQIRRTDRRTAPDGEADALADLQARGVGLFIEDRIRERAREARARRGIRRGSAEQDALLAEVRRQWALPEIAWLAVTAAAFVVLAAV